MWRRSPQDRPLPDGRVAVYRHPLLVRVAHWASALSVVVLLLSGLQILNAHPALYWGEASRFDAAFAAIGARDGEQGPSGWLRVAGVEVDTTGVLGVSKDAEGALETRAFPRWATLPGYLDLGAGRQWHFFFAWVLAISAGAHLAHGVISGRLRRDLSLSRGDLAGIGRSVWDHLRLRVRHDEPRYNVLQKLAYLAVLLVIVPGMIVTGLAMSPAMDARLPWLTEAFGGRQTARSVHFLGAFGLSAFIVVHLLMVLVAGPVNLLRSILTGWFVAGSKRTAP
jgi:thiosulfate reductase cytochrome b subunit